MLANGRLAKKAIMIKATIRFAGARKIVAVSRVVTNVGLLLQALGRATNVPTITLA